MIIYFLGLFFLIFNIYSSFDESKGDNYQRTIVDLLDHPKDGEIEEIKNFINEINKKGQDYEGPESLEFFYLELIKQCSKNNLKRVKKLLDLGLDINISWIEIEDDNCHMLLTKLATMIGSYEIVKYLFSKKAIIIFPGDTQEFLLIDAINAPLKLSKTDVNLSHEQKTNMFFKNRLKLIKFLLDNKVNRDGEFDEETAFRYAVNQGDLKLVQMFIFYEIPWYGGSITEQKNLKKRISELQIQFRPKFFKASIDINRQLLPIIQLLFIDHDKALSSNLFSKKALTIYGTNLLLKINRLFKAVEEGSYIDGNMTIVKKLKKYIKLGFVNKNNDSLIDIAIKNHDKKMIVTLLGQDQECNNCLLDKDWNQELAIERVIKNNCGQLDIIEFLVNLAYIY